MADDMPNALRWMPVFLPLLVSGCYLIAGPTDLSHGATATGVVAAGSLDTVMVAGRSALEVDNRAGNVDLEIALEEYGGVDPLAGNARVGLVIRATPLPIPGASTRTISLQDPDFVPARAFLAGPEAASGLLRQFGISHPADPSTIIFWTTGTSSEFVDPTTGQVRSVEAVSLSIPVAESSALFLALQESDAGCPSRLVDHDPSGTSDAVPVVFIHGWQPTKEILPVGCGWLEDWFGSRAPFEELMDEIGTSIDGKPIRRLSFRYDSRKPIPQNAASLLIALDSAIAQSPIIVAHSMGGLVARSLLTFSQAKAVRGVVTIGTPHLGAPIATALSQEEISGQFADAIDRCTLILGLIPPKAFRLASWSAGLADMDPQGEFILSLKDGHPQRDRIYALAGYAPSALLDPVMYRADCMTRALGDNRPSDGVVPLNSALPEWSAGQHRFAGVDHSALAGNSQVAVVVRDALHRFIQCDTGTPSTVPGEFPISGTITRRSPTEIEVTLNAVLIDGELQPPLTTDQITVVENGCAIPATDLIPIARSAPTAVDMVFVQDLSASMQEEILGVRNSVLNFASSLASRGLDVRLGSVGFSGDGTIPPTPNPAGAGENLGPVQHFSSAPVFQQHVAQFWHSTAIPRDHSENGLEAIEYAVTQLVWRPAAARVMITITDVSHHTSSTSCSGRGPCTDQNLSTILDLLGGGTVVHAIAPSSANDRSRGGGLDPWALATATGGKQIPLGDGELDLMSLGLVDVLASTTTFRFRSASTTAAPENLRILVNINGKVGEFRPGLVTYLRQ